MVTIDYSAFLASQKKDIEQFICAIDAAPSKEVFVAYKNGPEYLSTLNPSACCFQFLSCIGKDEKVRQSFDSCLEYFNRDVDRGRALYQCVKQLEKEILTRDIPLVEGRITCIYPEAFGGEERIVWYKQYFTELEDHSGERTRRSLDAWKRAVSALPSTRIEYRFEKDVSLIARHQEIYYFWKGTRASVTASLCHEVISQPSNEHLRQNIFDALRPLHQAGFTIDDMTNETVIGL